MFKSDDTPEHADRRGSASRQGGSRVGPSIVIRGELVARDEQLEIFGRVEGVIEHDHALIIRRGGVVQAAVIADDIRVEGALEGDAYARQRLHLARGASARGSLLTPKFSVEEGATLQGHVDMEAGEDTVEQRFRESAGRKDPAESEAQASALVPAAVDPDSPSSAASGESSREQTVEAASIDVSSNPDSRENTGQGPEDVEEAAGPESGSADEADESDESTDSGPKRLENP